MNRLSKEELDKLLKTQKPAFKSWDEKNDDGKSDEDDLLYYLKAGLTVKTIFNEKLLLNRPLSTIKGKRDKFKAEGRL